MVFLPLKSPASLRPHLPLCLSSSPANVCVPSPLCGHPVPLGSSTSPLCSPTQTRPRSPSQPFQKGQGSPCIHPFTHAPPPATCLAGPLPSSGLEVTGFSEQHLDGRTSEAHRNRAAAPGSRGSPALAAPLPADQGGLTASHVLSGRNLRRAPTPPSRMKTPKVGVVSPLASGSPGLLAVSLHRQAPAWKGRCAGLVS